MSKNALVIEDDLSIGRALEWLLASINVRATLVSNGVDALALLNCIKYDIVILDLMLGDIDGIEMMKAIPADIDARILVLSADDDPRRKVAALTSGARDYVVKPFDHAELCARIKLVMHHTTIDNPMKMTGPLQIDCVNHTTKVNGELLLLTRTEQNILEIFSENKGRIIPRNALLYQLYEDKWGSMSGSAVSVYIHKIRKKIFLLGGPANGCINSLKGRGYVFNDPAPPLINENYGVTL